MTFANKRAQEINEIPEAILKDVVVHDKDREESSSISMAK
jgi:hypothetical protein